MAQLDAVAIHFPTPLPGQRQQTFRRLSLQGAFLAIGLMLGCERTAPSKSPEVSVAESAEADFEWAMQRLKRAIDNFHPPSSLGIHVRREMCYEYHPADSQQQYPTAEVTVSSKTMYNHGRGADDKQSGDDQEDAQERKRRERQRKLAQLPADASEMDEQTLLDLEAMADGDDEGPGIVRPRIEPQTIDEEDVYELEYKNRRWQLVEEPELEHVQLWFEYALGR